MKKNFNYLILSIFILIILIIIYYFCFYTKGIIIPCLFHEITGLYCPGCGTTRMMYSLFRFDFYQAFRYNPLIFISIPFILICLIDFIIKSFGKKTNYIYQKINNKQWLVLLIITLIYGILRNIPYFDFLLPTVIK